MKKRGTGSNRVSSRFLVAEMRKSWKRVYFSYFWRDKVSKYEFHITKVKKTRISGRDKERPYSGLKNTTC